MDIRGIKEYLEEFNKLNIEFIKENLSNQTILQFYIEQELIDNSFLLDYEISQLENFVSAPWYKKLTQSQREKLLRIPCDESQKIITDYNHRRALLQERISAEVSKRERNG